MLGGRTSIRVVGAAVGAVVVLGLAVLAALTYHGNVAYLARYTLAEPCPSGVVPLPSCLATLPADVVMAADTYGEDDPHKRKLGLDIPNAPAFTPRDVDGTIIAWLTVAEGDRLDIPMQLTETHVTVTMFDDMVVDVTGPNGERAETRDVVGRPALAGLELSMWSLVVALVVAVAVHVRRRLTDRRAAWLWPTLAAVGGGLVIGMTAVLVTGTLWAFCVAYVIAAAVVAVAAAITQRSLSRS
jgi:hypothetical protein